MTLISQCKEIEAMHKFNTEHCTMYIIKISANLKKLSVDDKLYTWRQFHKPYDANVQFH